MSENSPYILSSVSNALSIIELLVQHDELGALEVATYMDMGKSTAFRLLTTLASHNFVTKTKESRYRLSFKLASIGSVVTERLEITHIAQPHLQALCKNSGETAHLVIWADDIHIQFVAKVIGRSSIRMASMSGVQMVAHMTATGKVLLANASPAFIEHYLENAPFEMQTPHSIPSSAHLRAILEDVRRAGYGYDLDESEEGLTCFAAPIYDMQNHVMAAVSVSGPSVRMRRGRPALIDAVKQTAQTISDELK